MRDRRWRAGLLLVGLLCGGCSVGGSPPAEEDDEVLVAPSLAPPPADGQPLSREQVLDLARSHAEPGDAIRELDQRPFAFRLDGAALDWFGRQGLDPAVLDYLGKRSLVDWESLRGDVDPTGPGKG